MKVGIGALDGPRLDATPGTPVTRELLDKNGLFNGRAIRLIAGAAFGMFGGFAVMLPLSLSIFVKPLVAAFGWTRTEASLPITMSMLGMTICAPFMGWLVRRVGARRVLSLGYAALCASLLTLAALPDSVTLFSLVCLVAGLSAAITTPGGLVLIIGGSFDRRIALAAGLAMMGLGLGALTMPLVLSALIQAFGWRGAFIALAGVAAVFGVIAIIMIFGILPSRPPPPAQIARDHADVGATTGELIRTWRFTVIAGALLLTAVAAGGSAGHIPSLLADQGFGTRGAALGASLVGAGVLAGRLGAAILMDRFFAPRVICGCFVAGGLGIFTVLHAPDAWGNTIFAGVFLIGLISGADGDMAPVLTRRYFGPTGFDRLFGILFACMGFGGIAGPLLAGYCFDSTGNYRLFFHLAALSTALSGCALLSLGAYRFKAG